MKGNDLKLLRDCAQISQSDMAEILGVSLRTIAKWESNGDNPIGPGYTKVCRTSFENLTLAPILRRGTEMIFEKIPSEFVGIWLVKHSLVPRHYASDDVSLGEKSLWEVVLLENTARYQCLCKTPDEKHKCSRKAYCDEERAFYNDRIQKNLAKKNSLTTYPLHSGETLNLTGDDIANAPWKFYPGRGNPYYHDQLCHSLLHMPYHIPSTTGPQPVALLSLENKLERDENGQWKVKIYTEETTGIKAFTEEDEHTAKNLIKRIYEEELKKITNIFDYLSENGCLEYHDQSVNDMLP